jgi:hypothetical protein
VALCAASLGKSNRRTEKRSLKWIKAGSSWSSLGDGTPVDKIGGHNRQMHQRLCNFFANSTAKACIVLEKPLTGSADRWYERLGWLKSA